MVRDCRRADRARRTACRPRSTTSAACRPWSTSRSPTSSWRARCARVLGDEAQVAAPQSLGGEDFGWYLERVPGAMVRPRHAHAGRADVRPAPGQPARRRARRRHRRAPAGAGRCRVPRRLDKCGRRWVRCDAVPHRIGNNSAPAWCGVSPRRSALGSARLSPFSVARPTRGRGISHAHLGGVLRRSTRVCSPAHRRHPGPGHRHAATTAKPSDDPTTATSASTSETRRRSEPVRHQGRHGLRRRWPRRPVVQRLRCRRSRPGRRGVRRRGRRSPRPRTARPRPLARSACAPSPTPATTRSSRWASPTPRRSARSPRSTPTSHFAIIDDSSLDGRPERRQPGLRRGAGLVPGRRGGRAQVRGRPHRLRRWRPGPADREVPGGLRGRRQGGQPGHQDRRHLPDPAAGLLRLR